MEMGKPFAESLDEIDTVADFLEYYGELARDEVGRIVAPVDSKTMSLVRYESTGVIGCIIPWNYPLALMGWKLAPALAAGIQSLLNLQRLPHYLCYIGVV